MRLRSVPWFIVVIAVVATAGAWIDKPHAHVANAPTFVPAAKPWTTVVELSRRGRRLDGFRPTLEVVGADGKHVYNAADVGSGRYRVRVTFPRVGEYTYQVRVENRVMARGTIFAVPE